MEGSLNRIKMEFPGMISDSEAEIKFKGQTVLWDAENFKRQYTILVGQSNCNLYTSN